MSVELEILLHGERVGVLSVDGHGQRVLRFNESYTRNSGQRHVLGQKFEDDLTRSYRGKKGSLPPFFANLIPESSELRPLLEQQLGLEENDDLALLEALGGDLPGAVEVRRLGGATPAPTRKVTEDAIEPTIPRTRDEESMRFSIAGVQLKFSVLLAEDRITLPAHGGLGNWLVKLDSRRFPKLCENEYAVMRWARLAGFDIPDCLLLESNALLGTLSEHASEGSRVLLVRRYDRNGAKVHQEDFAQVFNLLPLHKYDHVSYGQLAKVIGGIIGEPARDEYLARLAFVLASGNMDAHLKNWSLIYPDRIHARLAPVYDQVATVAWPEVEQKLALPFGGSRELARLDARAVERFAKTCGSSPEQVSTIFEQTWARVAAAWTLALNGHDWSMPEEHVDALRNYWRSVPLLRKTPLVSL